MSVGAVQIHQVTQTVWSTVLGLKIQPTKVAPPEAERFVIGKVSISGAWRGAVTVGCSAELARSVAASMFALLPGAASLEEIRDAVGELTNMVGGNIKSLMKGDCRLSVPAVVEGVTYGQEPVGPTSSHAIWFVCEGGVVRVCLIPE
jgi:CheY-specific phosphatase CheX